MNTRHGPSPAKDWQQIRERLAQAHAILQQAERLSPERARAILEERGRILARVPPHASAAAEMVEVLTFALGQERYGIGTNYVREVLPFADCALVPETPPFVIGVVNVRGQILALFDLSKFFGLADQEDTAASRIVVLGEERAEFGVRATAVCEVVRLRTDEVLEPPASVPAIVREYLFGVTKNALLLLDGAVLSKDPRLFIEQAQGNGTELRGDRA